MSYKIEIAISANKEWVTKDLYPLHATINATDVDMIADILLLPEYKKYIGEQELSFSNRGDNDLELKATRRGVELLHGVISRSSILTDNGLCDNSEIFPSYADFIDGTTLSDVHDLCEKAEERRPGLLDSQSAAAL